MRYLFLLFFVLFACPENASKNALSEDSNEKNVNNPQDTLSQKQKDISPLLFKYLNEKENIPVEKETIFITISSKPEDFFIASLNPQHAAHKKIYQTFAANKKSRAEGEFVPIWRILILKEGVSERIKNEGLKTVKSGEMKELSKAGGEKVKILPSPYASEDPFQKMFLCAPGTFELAEEGENLFLNLAIYKRADTVKDKGRTNVLAGVAPVYNFLIQLQKVKD